MCQARLQGQSIGTGSSAQSLLLTILPPSPIVFHTIPPSTPATFHNSSRHQGRLNPHGHREFQVLIPHIVSLTNSCRPRLATCPSGLSQSLVLHRCLVTVGDGHWRFPPTVHSYALVIFSTALQEKSLTNQHWNGRWCSGFLTHTWPNTVLQTDCNGLWHNI